MKKIVAFLALSSCAGIASVPFVRDGDVSIKYVHPIEISSVANAYAWSRNDEDRDPTEAANYSIQSYMNPYGLWINDKSHDQYSTFGANGHLVKWSNGFAIQLSNNDTFLCAENKLSESSCFKVYKLSKHGLSKSPLDEI
jgi:hypothetical protein